MIILPFIGHQVLVFPEIGGQSHLEVRGAPAIVQKVLNGQEAQKVLDGLL